MAWANAAKDSDEVDSNQETSNQEEEEEDGDGVQPAVGTDILGGLPAIDQQFQGVAAAISEAIGDVTQVLGQVVSQVEGAVAEALRPRVTVTEYVPDVTHTVTTYRYYYTYVLDKVAWGYNTVFQLLLRVRRRHGHLLPECSRR